MTTEQIKEALSRNFIGAISANKAYKIVREEDTGGVDISIKKDTDYIHNGHRRNIQDAYGIEVQLKSTEEHRVIIEDNLIKYDLEVKNYNDLIHRRGGIIPLILILYVLPDNRQNWISVNENELILRKKAYWYHPDDDLLMVDNVATRRIEIPYDHEIRENTIDELFDHFFN